MKPILLGIFLACILIQCTSSQKNTQAADAAQIEAMVTEHKFVFEAESMNPLRGSKKFLSTGYQLRVNKDSLFVELPFIGQSRLPAMNRDEAGYYFETTDFNYKLEAKKNNSWMITLDINDQKFTRQMILHVYNNGKASLDVYSNYRDQTNYTGYLSVIGKP